MNSRSLHSLVMAASLMTPCLAFAQGSVPATASSPSKKWTPPKTAWGDPDLQGVWTTDDLNGIPLQRPAKYGTRRFLTEQELLERAKDVDQLNSTIETGQRPTIGFWANQKGVDAAAVPAQWVEFARHASRLTSLVVDPPNGQIPPLTPDGEKRRAAAPDYFNMRPASWEDLNTYDRCITRGVTGSFFPSIYGNGSQIFQTPGAVAIRYEMIHETRIIPLDGSPHASDKLRSYMGDPRGHWEGNTLVVETTNFIGGKVAIGFVPYSEDLKLVERFTRTDQNTVDYEVTISDPKTFTAPWKVEFPIVHEPGYQIFEYACHEGNKAMHNRLSAARALEAADLAKAAPKAAPVVGILNYIHAVNSLDKTLAFYKDVFGLEGEPRPFPNPGVPALTNSPGVSLRLAVLKLPNAGFGFELTEFSGVDRKPGQARHTDPGAALLTLRVRDIAPIYEAIKKANAPIITSSGAPVKISTPNGDIHALLVRDPDGYVIEVAQAPPPADTPATGNVYSAAMGLTVADMGATQKFYHDLLGFDLTGKMEFASTPQILDLTGAPNAQFREMTSKVPGTNALMAFYEYKDIPRSPFHLRVPDPGAPAVALRVKDLDGLLSRLRAAGVPVTSLRGEVVQFTPTIRNIFVTDPNGLNIELFESMQ